MKRWERGILASSPTPSLPAPASSFSGHARLFSRVNLLRRGLGFPVPDFPGAASRSSQSAARLSSSERRLFADDELFSVTEREDGELEETSAGPRATYVIPIDETDPERTHRLARAYADDARLQRDLRAAGLL